MVPFKFASDEQNSRNSISAWYLEFCSSAANLNGTIDVSGVDLVGVGAISIFFKKHFFFKFHTNGGLLGIGTIIEVTRLIIPHTLRQTSFFGLHWLLMEFYILGEQ